MFGDLFVNLSIIIALTFIYMQLKWKLKLGRKLHSVFLNLLDGVAAGILGLILMKFSIHIGDSTIVDLRYLPIILITLHRGYRPAILSGVIIIIGRFAMGVSISAYMALLLMAISLAGFLLIRRASKPTQSRYVTGIFLLLYSNIAFTAVISYTIADWEKLQVLLPTYWSVSVIGGFSMIFFVEYILRSQYLLDKYEMESTTDYLTGLNNVRQFDAIWNEMVRNAEERDEKLSLLAMDIDFFKKVNDTYGHAAGDLVLAELAKVLSANARSFDIVSRNGGEEFSAILQDCDNERAAEIAERIRKGVEAHEFPISDQKKIKITISIGIATYPDEVKSTDEMKQMADECLYEAKRTGRNKVCTTVGMLAM